MSTHINALGRRFVLPLFLVALSYGCGSSVGASPTDDNAELQTQLGELGSELRASSADKRHKRILYLEKLYTRFWFGEVTLPIDRHGNTVVGQVVFMPIPEAPGDGTPGSINVTLKQGQSFFLPLFGLFGTSYSDGTPPDPFEPVSIFETLDIHFSIDGVSLIDDGNVMDFFLKYELTPPVPYEYPPLSAVIWGEDIAVFHPPLRRGEHTLKLDVINTEPAFGGFLEYHNTWNINVVRH